MGLKAASTSVGAASAIMYAVWAESGALCYWQLGQSDPGYLYGAGLYRAG